MSRVNGRRVPEYFSTSIRKVEPIGGDVVRLYFAVARGGVWDDLCTVLMPAACLTDALGFAVTSAREIAAETEAAAASDLATAH